MIRRILPSAGIYLGALLLGIFSLFPFAWMLITSVKDDSNILTETPVFIPTELDLSRYAEIFTGEFARAFVNSAIVSAGTVALGVGVSVLAGYSLARFRVPLRRYLLVLVLSVQMLPLVVLIIPLFVVMRTAGLLDSYLGLILAYMSFTAPLAVWMMRGFFQSIPPDMEDAAMVDGATRMGAFLRVVLPVAGPGIAATAIYAFIIAWNEFLFALTFISQEEMRTLPVALQSFIGRSDTDWGTVMAASVLFTLPVLIFFLFVHKRLTQGMATGALKG